MNKTRFDNVFRLKKKFFTKSLYSDFKGFEEKIIRKEGSTYREVDPTRSKLFAAFAKDLSQCGIREGSHVLYLGASHGYTPTFVSDMIGDQGAMMCIDIAPRVVRDLVFVCEKRKNMAPLLANCRHPDEYKNYIPKIIDVVFQDISQKDQVQIFLDNCNAFLKSGGFGVLALKARSIDVSKRPKVVFNEAYKQLEKAKGYVLVDKRTLEPFEKDHMLFVLKKR